MGSATTQAIAATISALSAEADVDFATARELFDAARIVGDSPHLSGALADSSATSHSRANVVEAVFGGAFAEPTLSLLTTAVQERWSSPEDLVEGIEELAIRAASLSAPEADLDGELFGVAQTIAANPELELALGSKLGDDSAKGMLVSTLLSERTSPATVLIVSSLVQRPRSRRVRESLSHAMRVVADQRGSIVATVVTAAPLSAAQTERLREALAAKYGTRVGLNAVIDPSVVGGLRVQIAGDVIDASIAARLAELRQRIAG